MVKAKVAAAAGVVVLVVTALLGSSDSNVATVCTRACVCVWHTV